MEAASLNPPPPPMTATLTLDLSGSQEGEEEGEEGEEEGETIMVNCCIRVKLAIRGSATATQKHGQRSAFLLLHLVSAFVWALRFVFT